MKKPFFSIGIIFKDEIRCLERCLKSLQPLRDAVPCELVMADTGSTDGSRKVAERYADILFDFPWCDDFSAARNAVMDRCSGQWYFTIDADEWLTGSIDELVMFAQAKKLPNDLGAIHIHNYNTVELNEAGQYYDFSAVRLLRMSTGIRYTGCIHEKWVFPGIESPKAMMLNDTCLKHDGYAYVDKAAEQAKVDRNKALLKKKLAENPDDMQTLVECIDITKHETEGIDYARKVIEVILKKPLHWEKFGPVVFRGAVSVGKLQKLPELREWIDQAMEWFPNSVFTKVDVAYYAMAEYFDAGDYAQAIYWGSMYQDTLKQYHVGEYDHNELLRGGLEYVSPFWERKAFILLVHSYLELRMPERALSSLQAIKGEEVEDLKQVESVTQMMLRLHRTSMLDVAELMVAFWKGISQPVPSATFAEKRRKALLSAGKRAFSVEYRKEENQREDTLRHGSGIFAQLAGKCSLGNAAAILETEDVQSIARILTDQEDLSELPGVALIHALKCGILFPLPDKMLSVEKMDLLAARLSEDKDILFTLTLQAAKEDDYEDWQKLMWVRGLAMASVQSFDWKNNIQNASQGMALARTYAKIEKEFLPRCYAEKVLQKKLILVLPPMHRFGWYCVQAFDALGAGDTVSYVRLLREGLSICESMKPMVEFLLDHTPELQAVPAPTDELKALAEQIRAVLARFAPDDPMVAALKQSEAYQKVAYLIEGTEPPIMGGQMQ